MLCNAKADAFVGTCHQNNLFVCHFFCINKVFAKELIYLCTTKHCSYHAKKRGFLLPGKRIDYERTAVTVLDEFRSGKIGCITLELPPAGK